jgi:hypothetical protein
MVDSSKCSVSDWQDSLCSTKRGLRAFTADPAVSLWGGLLPAADSCDDNACGRFLNTSGVLVLTPCCPCRVEDIPLSILAGHRSTPRAPAFATMQPRAAAPTAAAVEPAPGDLLQLDAAAAADAVRCRAVAGAVSSGFGAGAGFINLQRQLGREELRGSAAGINVLSAADVEAASWIGYYMDPRRPDAHKPRAPGVLQV